MVIVQVCSVALSVLGFGVFSVMTQVRQLKWGYAHVILGLWMLFQIPSLVLLIRLPEIWDLENRNIVRNMFSKYPITEQLATLSISILLWTTVSRFKRVEV